MMTDRDILLVEDEPLVRRVWERYLDRWGYRFDLTGTGQEGLDLARRNRYRILLTNLDLTGLPGRDLIHILKEEQPELAIIVVTGKSTVEMAVDIMKAGAYDFITKPINFVHAELLLKNCLDQLQVQQESLRLRRLAEDLGALNELKKKFIAITNHELRTPVGVLKSVVDILEKELPSGELGMLVSLLSRSTSQLVDIVEQMHEISQVRSDKLALHIFSFPLRVLCHEVMGEFWLSLQKRKLGLNLKVLDHLVITADRAKFKRVLRELIQNAIKFTGDEGSISIEAETGSDGQILLTVMDTGIGIEEKHLERIFELFYEVGQPTHHHSSQDQFLGGGMGVGLSIVNDIVSAHGGSVRVVSEVGKGSRFTVILPQGEQEWLEAETT